MFCFPGENATLSCKIGSVPSSKVQWYRDGTEILNNSLVNRGQQQFVIQETGGFEKTSTLVLTQARPEDSGPFMCVSQNQAGRVEANFTLQVCCCSCCCCKSLYVHIYLCTLTPYIYLNFQCVVGYIDPQRCKKKQILIDIFRIFLNISVLTLMQILPLGCGHKTKPLKFLTNFLYTQVGYFVGGVASLESGQIAGIAVTFASIALVLLVFLLVFLLRHRHCSSSMVLCSSRNNKQTSANGHLQVEKANANGHVIHQTLNVSYLVWISL